EKKCGVHNIGNSRGAAAPDIGDASGWNTDAHGSAEDSRREIRDPVSSQFRIGIAAPQLLMTPAKMLNGPRSKQKIDECHERQCQPRRQDLQNILRSPRKTHEWRES